MAGHQHTIRFHIDDLMSSHVNAQVNNEFALWLNRMYGKHTPVKCTRGLIHDYLGMTLDFSEHGIVKVDMVDYIEGMLEDSLMSLGTKDTSPTPAAEDLFVVNDDVLLLRVQAELFHTIVTKGLFVCKRAHPDIHPAIAFLCTRVRAPTVADWDKLV